MSVETTEHNKTVILSYLQTWNRGDLVELSRFWSPGIVHHTRRNDHGYESIQKIISDFMSAFEGTHFEIHDVLAEGDKVVTRMTWSATHTGSYLGLPPTGKSISCAMMGMARIKDGKIVEHWGVTDELHMIAQLGLLPEGYVAAMG